MSQISIVIPCLNERETINDIINDARQNADKWFPNEYELIVADNGSTDGSLDLIKGHQDVRLVNVPIRGYGAALHWGIMNAKSEYAIFADADMSYRFLNLEKFKPLLAEKPDLLLGSRLRGNIEKGAMPSLHRYVGTPVLTTLIRLLYGIPTSDCNSGMRFVRTKFYRTLKMSNSGMEWASELLLKTALYKGKYLETPIEFFKDQRKEGVPHLSTWRDGWRHLKAIMLLKPISLVFLSLICGAIAASLYTVNFALSFFAVTLAVLFGMLFASSKFIEYAIVGNETKTSKLLKDFPLVKFSLFLFVILVSGLVFLPDDRLGTKLILSAGFSMYLLWVFFNETIKTHLLNRLPENLYQEFLSDNSDQITH